MLPSPSELLLYTPAELAEQDADEARLAEIERNEYFREISLFNFVKDFWHILEPANPFVDNWHIGAITEHLEACFLRQIRQLAINIFFRSAKSTIVSVMYPAWCWTKKPEERFFCASYAEQLATRDADHSRLLIESEAYQKYYGDKFSIRKETSAKGYFENNKMGSRRSIGTKAQTTGFGGAQRILDDPNDTQKSESEVDRNAINNWFDKTWSSRSDDFNTSVSILIQQRTNEDDVTGHVIAKDLGYEVLKIPLEYEGKKYFTTSLNIQDPRTELGESADKLRFPPEVILLQKKTLGTAYSGQAQQNPAPVEGGMFPSDRAEIIEANEVPNNLLLIRYWDKAFTEGGGAYTAGVLLGKDWKTLDYYILDVVRGQWASEMRDQVMLQTAQRDAEKYGGFKKKVKNLKTGEEKEQWFGGRVFIWIEQEPGKAGISETLYLIKNVLQGFPAKSEPATGDKTVRATPFSSQWGAGNVKLVRGDWNTDYKIELGLFPNGKYKDQVDASSGGFNKAMSIRIV